MTEFEIERLFQFPIIVHSVCGSDGSERVSVTFEFLLCLFLAGLIEKSTLFLGQKISSEIEWLYNTRWYPKQKLIKCC